MRPVPWRASARRRNLPVAAPALALALLAAVLPAFRSDRLAAAQAEAASVRVVHALADAGPIDIAIDGRLAVVGAAFPSATDPLAVAAGEHRLTVTASGGGPDAALVETSFTAGVGASAEIALVGSVADAQVLAFPVDDAPLDGDRARLRVVHASPDAGPVSVAFPGGDAVFPPVDYLAASEYAEVPGGAYALDVFTADGGVLLATLPDLAVAAGDVVDVYLVGQVADATIRTLVVRSAAPVTAVVGRAAAIRAGACDDPRAVVAPLGVVAPARGAEVGAGDAVATENGFGSAAIPFDDVVAAPHVVAVAASEDPGAPTVACGAVAGALADDGSLVVGLVSENGTPRGVAVVAPGLLDPATTDVSIFLVAGAPASANGVPAAAVPDVPPAADEAADGAIRVESAATPPADG